VPEPQPLYPVRRDHLDTLTGRLGIAQHAIGSRPDPAHGTCTDDVARALQVDLLHGRELGWAAVAASVHRNLGYLDESFDRTTRRFRNFRHHDGRWLDAGGSDDCQGRAMLALGETMAGAPDGRVVAWAERVFSNGLPASRNLRALRARASTLLACDAALRVASSQSIASAFGLLAERLVASFEPHRGTRWPWPEPLLTYENALPARALLIAGRRLESESVVDLGLEVLDWLIEAQTPPAGHLSPIGNGWWRRNGKRSQFDQQPIEATSLLLAAETALELTASDGYRDAAERAYGWFLGENDVGVAIAVPERGACHDGLTPARVNANQGAESTLMWLVALEHTRSRRRASPAPTVHPVEALAAHVG
jgi:hypothetical protein